MNLNEVTDFSPAYHEPEQRVDLSSDGCQATYQADRSFYTIPMLKPEPSHCGSSYYCQYWVALWLALVSADYIWICRD